MSQPTHASSSQAQSIDALKQSCPATKVTTTLPLALVEEIDQLRGHVPRSAYLALIVNAAMTRPDPYLPHTAADEDLLDSLAARRYAQHVRSIQLEARR